MINETNRNNSLSEININKLANNYSKGVNSVESQAGLNIGKMNDSLITSIRATKDYQIDRVNDRYPYSIVWTPLPLITWLLPFIGHTGICYSSGIIRDFAGPYHVSEDDMAFGRPTRYLQLDLNKVPNNSSNSKRETWDRGVTEASDEYKMRMHNIFCDNCHSHVACALNSINYDGSSEWNMVYICFLMLFKGKFVSFAGFLKTWLPFLIIMTIALIVVLTTSLLSTTL
jgi:hypothetical protein